MQLVVIIDFDSIAEGRLLNTSFAFYKYEEESKSNLNMTIKSQNHVVDGCSTDILCPPA
jgi:hypothetical protein